MSYSAFASATSRIASTDTHLFAIVSVARVLQTREERCERHLLQKVSHERLLVWRRRDRVARHGVALLEALDALPHIRQVHAVHLVDDVRRCQLDRSSLDWEIAIVMKERVFITNSTCPACLRRANFDFLDAHTHSLSTLKTARRQLLWLQPSTSWCPHKSSLASSAILNEMFDSKRTRNDGVCLDFSCSAADAATTLQCRHVQS